MGKTRITELFKVLTDAIIDGIIINPLVEEELEEAHHSLALELVTVYMMEHGYELTAGGKFEEKQETLIIQ